MQPFLVLVGVVVVGIAMDSGVRSAARNSLRDFAKWRRMVRRHTTGR